MRTRRLAGSAALVVVLAALVVLIPAGAAFAHEDREIGPYEAAVGFGSEPAYAGSENSVQMLIFDAKSGDPVVDLGPTLNVQVEYGDEQMEQMTMEPNFEVGEFGVPGDYRAFFIPTRPGDYSFHFTGEINGTEVDETFTSSESTFSSVDDPASVEFPVQDPTNGELGDAITRLQPRVDAAAAGQKKTAAQVASLQDDVDSAQSQATLALVVGVVLGLMGVALGTAGLLAARKARRPATATATRE